MTKADILGIELKKFKKKVSFWVLLFCLPFVFSLVARLAFGIDIFRKMGLERIWRQFIGPDNLLYLALLVPLIVLPLSLLYYKSRETVYKAWLMYSGLGLILFVCGIVMYTINPPSSGLGGPNFAGIEFVLLGIAYVTGSVLIWLYGVVTHFFRKK